MRPSCHWQWQYHSLQETHSRIQAFEGSQRITSDGSCYTQTPGNRPMSWTDA